MLCQREQGEAELSSEIQCNSDVNSGGDERVLLLIHSFTYAQEETIPVWSLQTSFKKSPTTKKIDFEKCLHLNLLGQLRDRVRM